MKRPASIYMVFLMLVFVSCNEDEELPPEPVINEIIFDNDSKTLEFLFTDGDGNFGLAPSDTLGPFRPFEDDEQTIPNRFYYNLWVDYFEKRDGIWEQIITASPIDFRVPLLTPTGQNKQLRVKVAYDMSSFIPFLTAESDTIMFQIRIVDRILNVSNTAETLPLVIPD